LRKVTRRSGVYLTVEKYREEERTMKRMGYLVVIPVLAILALILAACGAQPTPEAAPPAGAVEDVAAEEPADMAAEEAAGEPMEEATEEATEEPMEEAADSAGGSLVFQIVPDESEVRFVIDEVLNNAPKTVVGTTNSVSGEVVADYADTSGAQVTSLSVDLSTLETDNNFRNGALHSVILVTSNPDFQYAAFASTAISGLPESVTVGETYEFQITGDLTVHGVTKEITFEASVTPVSETRLEGSASATILYPDFDVNIPRLPPQVASVEETVVLEIDFVAVAG
jgi:polyisoprenoid-binding protein YceI